MNAPPINSSPAFSPARVTPHAWHAFGGIWRMTVRRFLGVYSLLTLAGVLALLALLTAVVFERGDAPEYTTWTTNFFLSFLVPVFAFLSGAGAMRDEMKPESVDYVLTRPVRRWSIVVFKFVAHVACIQLGYLLALAIVIGAGFYHAIPNVREAIPWLVLTQVLSVGTFAAFGFVAAVLTSRYLVLGLFYAGIVEFAAGNIPTQLNRISMTHQLRSLLHPVKSLVEPALVADQTPLTSVLVLAGVAVTMLAIAAGVFSRLELIGARTHEA